MKANILFTSAGRRVSLVQQFKDALRELNIEGKVVVCDCSPTAPTLFIADARYQTSKVKEHSYINELKEIILKEKINLVIPLIDNELELLSKFKTDLEEISDAKVLISDTSTCRMSFNKYDTYNFFKKNNILTPWTVRHVNELGNIAFPLFLKPAEGSCSIGALKINDEEELNFYFKRTQKPLIQEFISGQEYTVDVLCDFDSNIIEVIPRLRIETRAGEISKGMTVRDYRIIEASKEVVSKMTAPRGLITLQCFVSNNRIYFIEINPRFGGGAPLSILSGAKFPHHILGWILKQKFTESDKWKDGVVMLRYDHEILTHKLDAL